MFFFCYMKDLFFFYARRSMGFVAMPFVGWLYSTPMLMRNALLVLVLAMAAHSQWLNEAKSGVPRTRDGKPDLAARTPRANGKPDFTGLWQPDIAKPGEIDRLIPGLSAFTVPGDDPTTFSRYFFDVLADARAGEIKLAPEAEKILQANLALGDTNGPRCLPASLPMADMFPSPKRIVHTRDLIVVLYEGDLPRQIHMDGRRLPKDPQPAWAGYSVAKWEGDTLVVDTVGFNERAPLDGMGHPRSGALRMVEKMRRPDYGHMDVEVTMEDAAYYSKPIVFRYRQTLVPDDDLLEWVCTENEKDGVHMRVN